MGLALTMFGYGLCLQIRIKNRVIGRDDDSHCPSLLSFFIGACCNNNSKGAK